MQTFIDSLRLLRPGRQLTAGAEVNSAGFGAAAGPQPPQPPPALRSAAYGAAVSALGLTNKLVIQDDAAIVGK